MNPPTKEEREKIFLALEGPNVTWRTIGGISRETEIKKLRLYDILMDHLKEEVSTCARSSITGESLFASRKQLIQKMTLWEKIRAAFSDRIY